MSFYLRSLLLLAMLALGVTTLGLAAGATSREKEPGTPVSTSFEQKGVRVDFSIKPAAHDSLEEAAPTDKVREAEIAEISFRISDAGTGTPISPLEPAVWVNLNKKSAIAEDLSCQEKIGLYLQGTLSFQADIDLNKFYMLVMNNDHSISIVDPILGVSGITQLYGMTLLKERGEDWVADADENNLYVSMPKAGQVAVVNLETFKVVRNIEAGDNPVRMAIQADGRYLWVGNNAKTPLQSGVTVIDALSHKVVAFIPTGAGHHEIVFSDDSLTAFVTNSDSASLSLIDIPQLKKVADLPVGERPVAVAYSRQSQSAYVASEADGTVTVVDGNSRTISGKIVAQPGLIALRFAPDGRWGFAVNLKHDMVHVIDASDNSLSHNFPVGKQPHQVTFTDSYAYVRSLGASEMQLIPLSQLDEKKEFQLQTIPLGSRPPSEYPFPAVADAISPTGEWDSVIVASPADKTVYYYMEGMVAPMGTFPTYGRVPRAVRVIDRSLRETDKGVYSTKLRIPKNGDYEVAFLIDSPWVYNCFSFSAEANPVLAASRAQAPPKIEILNQDRVLPVGKAFKLRFTLRTQESGEPLTGVSDVAVLASRPPGNWQKRLQATPQEDGSYEALLTADQAGLYYLYFAIPSLKINYAELPYLVFKAATAEGG